MISLERCLPNSIKHTLKWIGDSECEWMSERVSAWRTVIDWCPIWVKFPSCTQDRLLSHHAPDQDKSLLPYWTCSLRSFYLSVYIIVTNLIFIFRWYRCYSGTSFNPYVCHIYHVFNVKSKPCHFSVRVRGCHNNSGHGRCWDKRERLDRSGRKAGKIQRTHDGELHQKETFFTVKIKYSLLFLA